MDPRRVAILLLGAFTGLLAFHLYLLQRAVTRGDALLSYLLLVAIAVFGWRIAHYARRIRTAPVARAPETADAERRRIRVYVPILIALLTLHAWLITLAWSAGDLVFVLLLSSAVVVFAIRLSMYARRWFALRRTTAGGTSP